MMIKTVAQESLENLIKNNLKKKLSLEKLSNLLQMEDRIQEYGKFLKK